MKWTRSLFVDNSRFYGMVLEGMWKNGEDYAKVLSDFLGERRLKGCRVLDIPCGIGRVSVPLARQGFAVTGVDFSPHFVSVAEKKARKFSVARKASFVIGTMKEVDSMFPAGYFDAAINIFTSIGFGSDRDDLLFFKGLKKVVRKGGIFVIGRLANRDYLFSHFMEKLYDETDKLLVVHKNEMDTAHSKMRSNWRFYLKKGKSLNLAAETPIELRLYSPHELVRLLEETGWRVSTIYNTLEDKRPYSPNNPGLTVIAEAV